MPAVMTIFVLAGTSGALPQKTEKHLVSYYKNLEQQDDSPMFYLDALPFSARFYSQGKAESLSSDGLKRMIESQEYSRVLVAIPKQEAASFLDKIPYQGQLLESNRRYQLYSFKHRPEEVSLLAPASSTNAFSG